MTSYQLKTSVELRLDGEAPHLLDGESGQTVELSPLEGRCVLLLAAPRTAEELRRAAMLEGADVPAAEVEGLLARLLRAGLLWESVSALPPRATGAAPRPHLGSPPVLVAAAARPSARSSSSPSLPAVVAAAPPQESLGGGESDGGADAAKGSLEERAESKEAAPAAPNHASLAEPLSVGDAVPLFRRDLTLMPKPGNLSLIEVTDPVDGRAFTLYDFEASLARMLDGQRPVSEMIEAAGHIGITVTLETLQKFLRQMRAYGFLDERAASPPSEEESRGRTRWTPEVRELYRGALRMFRLGKPDAARSYLDALLEIHPDNAEALTLRTRVEAELAGTAKPPEPSVAELLAPPAPAPFNPFDEPSAPPRGPTAALSPVAVHSPSQRRSTLPVKKLAIGAGAALLLGALVLVVPVQPEIRAVCQVVPASEPVAVSTPRAGLIRELVVGEGQWVEQGQILARLDMEGPLLRLAELEGEIEQAEHHLNKARAQHEEGLRRLTRVLRRKQGELAKLTAQRERLAKRSPDSRGLPRIDKNVQQLQEQVGWASEAVEKHRRAEEVRGAAGKLRARMAERENLGQALEITQVLAPAPGIIRLAKDRFAAGRSVASGEEVAQIHDTRTLRATARLGAWERERVEAKSPVSISLGAGGKVVIGRLASLEPSTEPSVWVAEALVDNPDRARATSTEGLASFEGRPVPLWRQLVR
jgi:multidrug resistance efflux pump